MSRDWTPREAYFADKFHFQETGQHFYEMKVTTFVMGKETLVHPTKEEEILYKKYPYLAITSIDNLQQLFNNLSKDFLVELEKYVKDLCVLDEGKNKFHDSKEFENKVINKWYNGQLDENFYYRERNDEYLLDYLREIELVDEIRNPNVKNNENSNLEL